MTPQQEARRHADGSIDIDFYRLCAGVERRAVVAAMIKGRGLVLRPLAFAAVCGAVLAAVLSSAGPDRPDSNVTAVTSGGARTAYPETTARLPSRVLTR